MNRISNHLPRHRFQRQLSSKQARLPQGRLDAEAMLRDMAYVLHLTRSVKESIVAQRSEEAV